MSPLRAQALTQIKVLPEAAHNPGFKSLAGGLWWSSCWPMPWMFFGPVMMILLLV